MPTPYKKNCYFSSLPKVVAILPTSEIHSEFPR